MSDKADAVLTREEFISFLWRAARTPKEEIGPDSDLAQGGRITVVNGQQLRKVTKTVSRLSSAKNLLKMRAWGNPYGTEEELRTLIAALSSK